jgi:hypothetical protein
VAIQFVIVCIVINIILRVPARLAIPATDDTDDWIVILVCHLLGTFWTFPVHRIIARSCTNSARRRQRG